MNLTVFDEIIAHYGSQAALARATGVSPMAVTHWRKRGIPVRKAHLIASQTNGRFPVERICPELAMQPPEQEEAA
jgi:DNA-binding transcriptional regulator YdaS (Cro superfamily)